MTFGPVVCKCHTKCEEAHWGSCGIGVVIATVSCFLTYVVIPIQEGKGKN